MLTRKNTFVKVCIYYHDQAANFSIHSRNNNNNNNNNFTRIHFNSHDELVKIKFIKFTNTVG